MPPKKKKDEGEEADPLFLGRFGTSLKIGIVGVPNVGKSTFFNVLCKQSIPAENFPFCTIDPNESRVAVPDERYEGVPCVVCSVCIICTKHLVYYIRRKKGRPP